MHIPQRMKRTYRIPQPAAPRAAGEKVLQIVALPAVANGDAEAATHGTDKAVQRRSRALQMGSASQRLSRSCGGLGRDPRASCGDGDLGSLDALHFLSSLDVTGLTDREAESIVYPYHAHPYDWSDVFDALRSRLVATKDTIAWHKPRARPGWEGDLRFLGDWWLSLRDPNSTTARVAQLGMNVIDLKAPTSTLRLKSGETNQPLLPPHERTTGAEDQLISDLAHRLHGRLFRLELLHIDELALTPDRLQVLLLCGILSVQQREVEKTTAPVTERGSHENLEVDAAAAASPAFVADAHDPKSVTERAERVLTPLESKDSTPGTVDCADSRVRSGVPQSLPDPSRQDPQKGDERVEQRRNGAGDTQLLLQTLSLSLCSMGTASALVLLTSLAIIEEHRRRHTTGSTTTGTGAASKSIVNLDLSYNALSSSSLYCLTLLLPKTAVKRLSLRGNNLCGGDSAATRDFLLEGCQHLQELDLSHTNLSTQQICVLMEALPSLPNLRVLSLDNLGIPFDKATTFARAVTQSQLWSISLNGCAACAGESYMAFLRTACDRHRACAEGRGDAAGSSAENFFEQFFSKSLARGWVPPELRALPVGYRPFTNNDPSLYERTGR